MNTSAVIYIFTIKKFKEKWNKKVEFPKLSIGHMAS